MVKIAQLSNISSRRYIGHNIKQVYLPVIIHVALSAWFPGCVAFAHRIFYEGSYLWWGFGLQGLLRHPSILTADPVYFIWNLKDKRKAIQAWKYKKEKEQKWNLCFSAASQILDFEAYFVLFGTKPVSSIRHVCFRWLKVWPSSKYKVFKNLCSTMQTHLSLQWAVQGWGRFNHCLLLRKMLILHGKYPSPLILSSTRRDGEALGKAGEAQAGFADAKIRWSDVLWASVKKLKLNDEEY